MPDLVIRGGTVVDGTGAPARTADVAVKDGLIAEIGRVAARGAREIDADGLLVTPGFVDIHTHYDGQASWDPVLAPSSLHGVTSLVMGNCGVGFAPARRDAHQSLIALLEGVEDIPGTALAEGLTWDWESFPDYLDALERRRFAVDIGAQLPHAALRAYVMGERGGDAEAEPDGDEIAAMANLTVEAMAAGALGVTTSRTVLHRSRTGDSIGTLKAGRRELLALASALAEGGRGVIQLISDAYLSPDPAFAEAEMDLLEAMAQASRRPLSFTVQQPDHAPERWRRLFQRAADARTRGLDIRPQVAPRAIGIVIGLPATLNPFVFCASYRPLAQAPHATRAAALRDPDVRARILAEHAALALSELSAQVAFGFERMFPLTDPIDYEPAQEASIAAMAAREGQPAAAFAYDLMAQGDGDALVYVPLINFAGGNLDAVHAMISDPDALFGLSDGGAHCNTICDASFPTTSLALWSRGNRAGKSVPLETLVHGYTRRNALHVGWSDRGALAPGLLADINIIDLERLSLHPPHLVGDLPAGGTRLMQTSPGYVATIKRGETTFEASTHTGALPGGLMRGAR